MSTVQLLKLALLSFGGAVGAIIGMVVTLMIFGIEFFSDLKG